MFVLLDLSFFNMFKMFFYYTHKMKAIRIHGILVSMIMHGSTQNFNDIYIYIYIYIVSSWDLTLHISILQDETKTSINGYNLC
jgi:hypothetical protein